MGQENRGETLLTPAQRDYFDGESDIIEGSPHERTFRTRARERIKNGLMDFEYLADPGRLDVQDFELIRQLQENGDAETVAYVTHEGELTDEPVLDPAIEAALVDLVAFAFRVRPNPGYFENLVREGVGKALRFRAQQDDVKQAEIEEVRVSIKDPDTIATQAAKKMDAGLRLTDTEVRVLIEDGRRSPNEVAEYLRTD